MIEDDYKFYLVSELLEGGDLHNRLQKVGSFDEVFTLVGGGTDGTAVMPLNVTSGGGADILDGGAGNDTIDGGAGAIGSFWRASHPVRCL